MKKVLTVFSAAKKSKWTTAVGFVVMGVFIAHKLGYLSQQDVETATLIAMAAIAFFAQDQTNGKAK